MQIFVIMVSDIGIWCYNGLDFDLDLNASASAHITFVVMFPVLVVKAESHSDNLDLSFCYIFFFTNVCLPFMITFIGRMSTGYLNQSCCRL